MMASPFDEAVTNTEKVIGGQTYKLQAEQKNQLRNRSCQIMRRLKRRLIELPWRVVDANYDELNSYTWLIACNS